MAGGDRGAGVSPLGVTSLSSAPCPLSCGLATPVLLRTLVLGLPGQATGQLGRPSRSALPMLPGLAAAAKSLQLCPTLCDPTDGSPTGSPAPGILQARTLEWVAISFSNA